MTDVIRSNDVSDIVLPNLAESVRAVEVDWDFQKPWDGFVDQAYNGTIFHKIGFLRYHASSRFMFRFLAFLEKNRLHAVLPFVMEDNVLKSPVGASFGGMVLRNDSLSNSHAILESFLSWAQSNGVRRVEFTHAPIIYNERLSQDLDYLLLYRGFSNSKNLFSSALDLHYFDAENPLKMMSSAGRRAVRKSFSEGLDVDTEDVKNLEEYYDILKQNKSKFDVAPAHSLDELIRLREIYPGTFKLFAIKNNGLILAGIYVFVCNKHVALAFYIASRPEFQHLRPVNRALYEVARWAKNQQFRFLDLGVSMNTRGNHPMEPAWSLVSFKEHIGTKGFPRPSYSMVMKTPLLNDRLDAFN